MSLVKPSRLYINNARRQIQMYADQFTVRLQAPIQGLTRFSVDTATVEYNTEFPNFPPYASKLQILFSDVVGEVEINIPNNVDWTSYTVNGQSAWPKNLQEYLNAEATTAGSSAVFTLTEGTSVGLPGFILWQTSLNVIIYGASTLDNPETSIMERLGFPLRLANRSIPQWTYTSPNRAQFALTAVGGVIASPANYILGRTSVIYILSDIDSNGQSDVGLQNIITMIPIPPNTGLGDLVTGEITNDYSTSSNPSTDFNALTFILLDDQYQPLELRDTAVVALELSLSYSHPTAVSLS